MRIRSLAFRGIGPFRDEQRIDFDALGRSGLYLINGPTGAGKSTIIDCICFALFGTLAVADADQARLRSDFATGTDPSEVDLVLETAAGTYRVIRSPRYLRSKQRGAGQTESKASAKVFRIGPDGREESIATNVASANAEIARVVGLTRDQFVQTVVLPQGAFAQFLTATTADRREILARVFDPRLSQRVADLLAADAAAARETRRAATAAVDEAVRALAAGVGIDDDIREELLEFARIGLDDDLRTALHALEPPLADRAEAARAAADAAAARATAADTARATAKAEADASSAAHAAQADVDECGTRFASARSAVAALAGADEDVGADDAEHTVAQWRDRAAATDRLAGELTTAAAAEEAVAAWPAQEARMVAAIEDARTAAGADRARLAELPALIADLEQVAQSGPSHDEHTRASERGRELGRIRGVVEALAAETARQPVLTAEVERALAVDATADRRYHDASRHHRAGIAAELAVGLEPGSPCPVCGALEHPRPAEQVDAAVTADEVEELRAAAGDATADLAAARRALSDSRQRAERLAGEAELTADALAEAEAEHGRTTAGLKARSDAAERADQQVRRLRAESEECHEKVAAADREIARVEESVRASRESIAAKAEQVARARAGAESVAHRRSRLLALADALRTAADRRADLDAATHARARANAALAELRADHDRRGGDDAAAGGSGESAGTADGPAVGFGDVAAARDRWTRAEDVRREAEHDLRDAVERLSRLRSGTTAVEAACERRTADAARSADLLDLADLVAPGRGDDFGLHVFVLRALFATVVEHANRRLEALLDGRFHLVPAPAGVGDGRSLHGLDIWIVDHLTGRTRPARSLSGGETFCASLALALGLSDVVRADAGGIAIGSLFVDEGFGSLDAESLEEVMTMLGHLGSEDRLVGVISHVDAMKSAISERIDVTRAGTNSPAYLRVSWAS